MAVSERNGKATATKFKEMESKKIIRVLKEMKRCTIYSIFGTQSDSRVGAVSIGLLLVFLSGEKKQRQNIRID